MLIFAHRGFMSRAVSENTLEAFQRGIDAGADGIEFDLRVSRDGMPVVVHDENLHRVAGDARRVRDLTRRELQNIPLRGKGRIPTLKEVISTFQSSVQFDVEIKDRDACPLLIRKLKTSKALRKRTVVSSFVFDDLKRVHDEVPEVRTLLLSKTWPIPTRGIRAWKKIQSIQPWGVGIPVNAMKKKYISLLREHGYQVAAWDLQPSARDARKLLKRDLDVAITYRPDVLRP
jgi:glycerophosphoryl diester phosphodiesterase